MAQTFRRYEKKYLLDENQYRQIKEYLSKYTKSDKFFKSKVNSIYYDTDTFELIRRSIEKPEYKEKLRIRTYSDINADDKVYVEFKKKLDGIVYKRRTKAIYKDVLNDIYTCEFKDKQIGNEIRYALNYYDKLSPKVFISCQRASFVGIEDENLRITFDENLLYRMNDLSLSNSNNDKSITDKVVMELKVAGSIPLWLSKILDDTKVYPRGFSKVGTAFLKRMEKAYE